MLGDREKKQNNSEKITVTMIKEINSILGLFMESWTHRVSIKESEARTCILSVKFQFSMVT